ncbi:hypothetical protein I317_00413 [Kwoniella heveanensis CBS 569]|nr:hypothetical protein I317_00413 [Kwoniella heveanensis CBS 569]
MSASPIPRRHSEMPQRATPPRRISAFTDAGAGPSNANGGGAGGVDDRRRGSAAASGSTLEQRRARREQLRNFYGIKADAEASEKDGVRAREAAGPQGDPLDIDSAAFNAAAYYEHLISKETLSGLMKKSSTLNSDIGNLEGSRHSLVYNHHHQLFAAGDTISHLNSRTPQLLSIVTELQSSFSSISQLVDSIALPESQDQAQRATGSGDHGQDGETEIRRKKVMERLKLMLRADEPAEKLREVYDRSQNLLGSVDGSRDGDRHTIEEVKRVINDLPPVPTQPDGEARGQDV